MKIKGLAAPIIMTVFVLAILIFYAYVYMVSPIPKMIKIIIAVVLLFLLGLSIYVLVERIKELKTQRNDNID